MWYGHMNSAAWWIMTCGMVLGVIAVVAIVALVIRSNPASKRAEDILAERFARGEIDESEYRRHRELIRK
jgi:putative membrane protein